MENLIKPIFDDASLYERVDGVDFIIYLQSKVDSFRAERRAVNPFAELAVTAIDDEAFRRWWKLIELSTETEIPREFTLYTWWEMVSF